MSDETPLDKQRREKIPAITKQFFQSLRALDLEALILIFNPDDGFLGRAESFPIEGSELVKMHQFLSILAMQMQGMENYQQTRFEDTDSAADSSDEQSKQKAADTLALSVLQVPEDMIPDRVRDMALKYMDARKGAR